jgi:hypothetical protein
MFILQWTGNEVENGLQTVKPGLSVAYEMVISKISFMFNFGVYLYAKEYGEGPLYQRLTLKYFFADPVFFNVVLNTNWGKAEYVGFGFGYRLNYIYKRKISHN